MPLVQNLIAKTANQGGFFVPGIVFTLLCSPERY